MNQRLAAVIGAVALFGAVSASAQGLPFSSDSDTNRPWSVNRMPSRDTNAYQPQSDRPASAQSAQAQDRVATRK